MGEPGEPVAATVTELERIVPGGRDIESIIMVAFEVHGSRLKGFALAAVRDADAADDLVAETFLRLVSEARTRELPDNIGAWLFRVCGNLITNRGRRRAIAQRWRWILVNRDTGRSPEDTVIGRERDEAITTALAYLPVDARVALLMAAQGCNSAEIGLAIGRSALATRAYICRGRARLRELLGDRSDANTESGR